MIITNKHSFLVYKDRCYNTINQPFLVSDIIHRHSYSRPISKGTRNTVANTETHLADLTPYLQISEPTLSFVVLYVKHIDHYVNSISNPKKKAQRGITTNSKHLSEGF